MSENENGLFAKYGELIVLAIVPTIVGVLALASFALEHWQIGPYFVHAGLALIATIFGGFQRFNAGFVDAYNKKITVNVFVATALIATVAIGEFRAAAIVVFIMSITGALETYTLEKTRKSIRSLLDITPKMATVRRGKDEVAIPVNEVQVDDVVIVRPGERVCVDGIVVAGASYVNQAPITGEPLPVEKFKGSEVFSGTLNETGRLEAQAVRVGDDTTLAKIVHLVEKAQETKAPIQNVADRFTFWFLPIVLVLAIIGFITSGDIKVAVSILLLACPCAFAIATPTAVTAGISNLARKAALVKGGIFIELAGKLDAILIDKTGALTFGRPKVSEVIAFGALSTDDVLYLAAIAEKYSEHPLARSILNLSKERDIEIPDPDEFKAEVGMGVTATWNNKAILAGKKDFLINKNIHISDNIERIILKQTELGRTAILVASGISAVGLIAIEDEIRPETANAIALLKTIVGDNITMLTGDNHKAAKSVADKIGINDFRAELLPEDKLLFVKKLKDEGRIVAMIGDGINDAPALALSDVGIAMGTAGADVAIETANVILMNDDLSLVADFILMSRKVITRIKLNIFFSIIYNVIGLILGSFGLFTPVLAVIFQEAGCLTVVFSSTLLLWSKTKISAKK